MLMDQEKDDQTTNLALATEATNDEEGSDAWVWAIWCLPEAELNVFVGLQVAPGYGLLDTGAQHGVLGPDSYEGICTVLAEYGVKPRIVPTLKMNAVGIGGSSNFTKSAEIPVGIAGTSGTLTIHVLPQPIPLLLPVGFLKNLGMILDLNEMTASWKTLGMRTSDVSEVGAGPHLAINIFEFPKTGWKNPHESS